MKNKLLTFIIIITILSLVVPNIIYSEALEQDPPQNSTYNKALIINHINALEKYKEHIFVLSKNTLEAKCGDTQMDIDIYIKDINFIKDQISAHLKTLSTEYQTYKDDDFTLNPLLTIGIILAEYRLALIQLNAYLQNEKTDFKYKHLEAFFSFMKDGNMNLYILKENLQ